MWALLNRIYYLFRSYSWLLDFRRFGRIPGLPIDRPIFLLGTQGGGLTLLSRMLRRHPQVISATGNCDYWSGADEIQNIYGLWLPPDLTGLRYKAPHHPYLTAPRSWTYAARDLYPLYRRKPEHAHSEMRQTLLNIIRLSALRFARNSQSFRFLDKSQSFTVRVGLIQALLADCQPCFILVTREPYISTFRAANGKAGDMARLKEQIPYEERIDICAEHLGNSMRAVFEDSIALGLKICLIQFENLLAKPEATLRHVCQFVELEFLPDMLPAAHHKIPFGSRFSDRWYPIRKDVNTPYERLLDPPTIEAVNRYCGDLIEPLGYKKRNI